MQYKKHLAPLFAVCCLLSVVFLSSCSMSDNPAVDPIANELDDSDWNRVRDDAFAAFADARADFFKGVPSVHTKKTLTSKDVMDSLIAIHGGDSTSWEHFVIEEDSSVTGIAEIDVEDYDQQEIITTLAWGMQFGGDAADLTNYLKQKGLYEKYQATIRKYNIEQHTKNLGMRKKAVSLSNITSTKYIDGDIFLKVGNNSSAAVANFLIPGYWGHAAFVDAEQRERRTGYFLLSASDRTDQPKAQITTPILNLIPGLSKLGSVGYDETDPYWTTEAAAVAIDRVRRATTEERRRAVVYATQYTGKPFNIATSREANDQFYCSKLVYRGWLSVGVELEPHDNWTREKYIKNIKLGIPIVITYGYRDKPDTWVAPDDLDKNNYTYRIDSF